MRHALAQPAAAVPARCVRRRRRARCAPPRASSDDADADAAFQALARRAGVVSPYGPPALALRSGAIGRGLFAARDLAPGEPLLSVPLPLCLAVERVAAVAVPGAPWEALMAGRIDGYPRLQTSWPTYPLPWDTRLALCLLDALDGAAGAPDSPAALLWRDYAELVPQPGSMSNPVSLPRAALAAVQHDALESEWAADAERIAALCPELAVAATDAAPSPLHYGVALARSRAFAAGDIFLVCPFVDMANTTFGAANATASLRVPPGRAAADAVLAADGSFDLSVGSGGIRAGEEVFISYGVATSANDKLLARYGFVQQSNPNDRVQLQLLLPSQDGTAAPALDAAALERAAAAACEAAGGRWMRERSTDGQLIAALASIPARPRTARPRPTADERADLVALRDAAAALLIAPTTLEDDMAALEGGQLGREAPLVRLRTERKALLRRVTSLLDAYAAALAPS